MRLFSRGSDRPKDTRSAELCDTFLVAASTNAIAGFYESTLRGRGIPYDPRPDESSSTIGIWVPKSYADRAREAIRR